MTTTTLTYSSATALARAIRDRELSAAEVVDAHLRHIEAVNPRLNAVVQLAADRARDQARAADAALARGAAVGPLHGVPVTIKDNLDTAGIVSTGGTQGRATFVPAQDATAVARLRAAGAIVLGKTNTPELTLAYETDNLVYGRTNNPYDATRTCGGSSGGAAAIIAAGGAPLDIGSDTGGSIRVPSHCCGTAGIRPTSGRVPRTGHILPPFGAAERLTSLGPMARRVEDLALALPILAGVDWRDPAIVPMPLGDPARVDLKRLRVALHTDNGIAAPTREVADTVTAAGAVLAGAGLAVTDTRPPGLEQTFDIFFGLFAADGGAGLRMLLDTYGTKEESPAIQGLLAAMAGTSLSAAQFGKLIARWDMFCSAMLAFMESYDVILCPVVAVPAPPHGYTATPEALLRFTYVQTYSLTGWPAAVVRCGTSPEGLPIGVQIVARPWREDVALAVAAHLEEAMGGWQPPTAHLASW